MTLKKISLILLAAMAATGLNAEEKNYITYEDFGAVGDGVHDDQAAIVAAHNAANEKGLSVRGTDGKTYYIGKGKKIAIIKTDVDWGSAKFIIDDVVTEDYTKPVFKVASYQDSYKIEGVKAPKKGQKKLKGVKLPGSSLLLLRDDGKKIYIRRGLNRNNGHSQEEMTVVDKNGKIRKGSDIIWDYKALSAVIVYPIDSKRLTIRGGEFTTVANQAPSEYKYRKRGIDVCRSNVLVEGIKHYITGEIDHGAPYHNFITVKNAADVTIKGCLFTAHKTYVTIGSAKKPVSMGSYDITASNAVNVNFIDCRQTTDIDDTRYWGVFASNYCKELHLDNCVFSRFDAHQGVHNVSLKNSTFGHQGIRMVGSGLFLIENCEAHSNYFIYLRSDYGSSWDGDIVIKNSRWRIVNTKMETGGIISGFNDSTHDYGYECCFPNKIIINGLTIDDSALKSPKYKGPFLFCNFKESKTGEKPFPYIVDGIIVLTNVSTVSGKEIRKSNTAKIFDNYKVL